MGREVLKKKKRRVIGCDDKLAWRAYRQNPNPKEVPIKVVLYYLSKFDPSRWDAEYLLFLAMWKYFPRINHVHQCLWSSLIPQVIR